MLTCLLAATFVIQTYANMKFCIFKPACIAIVISCRFYSARIILETSPRPSDRLVQHGHHFLLGGHEQLLVVDLRQLRGHVLAEQLHLRPHAGQIAAPARTLQHRGDGRLQDAQLLGGIRFRSPLIEAVVDVEVAVRVCGIHRRWRVRRVRLGCIVMDGSGSKRERRRGSWLRLFVIAVVFVVLFHDRRQLVCRFGCVGLAFVCG